MVSPRAWNTGTMYCIIDKKTGLFFNAYDTGTRYLSLDNKLSLSGQVFFNELIKVFLGNCYISCAADFSLLNLPKGKSLGRSKPATNS